MRAGEFVAGKLGCSRGKWEYSVGGLPLSAVREALRRAGSTSLKKVEIAAAAYDESRCCCFKLLQLPSTGSAGLLACST